MEAVAFTNHVSLLYYHGLLRALRNTGLNAKYTPREIMRIANNIRKINQPYAPGPTKEFITESVKGDREILEALGVHLYV